VRLYGCRPKSACAGLGSGLGWTTALTVTHGGIFGMHRYMVNFTVPLCSGKCASFSCQLSLRYRFRFRDLKSHWFCGHSLVSVSWSTGNWSINLASASSLHQFLLTYIVFPSRCLLPHRWWWFAVLEKTRLQQLEKTLSLSCDFCCYSIEVDYFEISKKSDFSLNCKRQIDIYTVWNINAIAYW